MTPAEQAVIEAAVEWANTKHGCSGDPGGRLQRAEWDLEQAIAELHAEHDGRWEPKE